MAANTSVSVDNEVPIKRDKFVCVEYPGRVENVDRMLETLGDEEVISKTINETNKRIELRFRPDDPYCKPVCGSLYPTTNLLVRVKRRYRKPKPLEAGQEGSVHDEADDNAPSIGGQGCFEDVEYKSEMLGIVKTTYRFTGMCDFQYLPTYSREDGLTESLIEKVLPSNQVDFGYFDQDIPYHLQPPSFSRSDIPVDYHYKPDQIQHRPDYPPVLAESLESNLIGCNRAKRHHNTYIVTYEKAVIPMAPHPNAVKTLERYKNIETKLAELKNLFDKRPMWSKNALKSHIDLSPNQFKVFLPMVSFYFCNGPWRAIWCKLGFDPRKTPAGKQYQMLDFRLRKVMVTVYGKGVIKAKRSTFNYRLPITVRKPRPTAVTIRQKTEVQEDTNQKESYYIFRKGLVPAYHQMFYQLCDLQDDDLQALIHRNDGKETTCDERNGWLEPDVLGELRDIITDILKETLISLKTGAGNDEHQPTTSQDKEHAAIADNDNDDDNDDNDDDVDALDQGLVDPDDNEEQDEDDDVDDVINEMEMEMFEYMDSTET